MNDFFQNFEPVDEQLIFKPADRNDVRLGELIAKTRYEEAQIVIVGCPQDEGVGRSGGRLGVAKAPRAIREQLYKLTPFGINLKICDLGDVLLSDSLEVCHQNLSRISAKILRDGKKLILLGGGNDISYASGKAMSETFSTENWLGVNISSTFGLSERDKIDGESVYRFILDEKLIRPNYFYEIGYQTHFSSPVYYRYLQELGVNHSSLEQIRSRETADLELREMMRQRFVHHSQSLSIFFGFSMTVVRSSDAPGNNFPSPLGLRAGEFIQLIKFAASLSNTRIIQFTDINPEFDVDSRTTSLVAIAMHRFCTNQSKT